MSLSRYLIIMTFSAILGWIAWILVLIYIDPFKAGIVGFVFFYLSLLFALIGTLSVIGYFIRSKIHKEEITYQQVSNAFRQAILLGILVAGSLFLKSIGLLNWFNIIIFIIALVLLEVFYLSRKNKKWQKQDSESEQETIESGETTELAEAEEEVREEVQTD